MSSQEMLHEKKGKEKQKAPLNVNDDITS